MNAAAREAGRVAASELNEAAPAPTCPVDRMPRRRRNQICIAIIALGAMNFLVYTLSYAALGGDAPNGHVDSSRVAGGHARTAYFVRGHFLRSLRGQEREVSRGLWIYSYVHSISVLATSGAMVISMLVLSRPHIVATMRDGLINGPTFVAAFGTVVILVTVATVFLFVWDFVGQLVAR